MLIPIHKYGLHFSNHLGREIAMQPPGMKIAHPTDWGGLNWILIEQRAFGFFLSAATILGD
jgi:hypothetical protein